VTEKMKRKIEEKRIQGIIATTGGIAFAIVIIVIFLELCL